MGRMLMGSNDKSVWSPIWGLEDVLPGHIFTQGTMLTKIFLDIYMEGVGDNEEVPAIQIARSKMGMRGVHREESWGWGLEVTEDKEGNRVAEIKGSVTLTGRGCRLRWWKGSRMGLTTGGI